MVIFGYFNRPPIYMTVHFQSGQLIMIPVKAIKRSAQKVPLFPWNSLLKLKLKFLEVAQPIIWDICMSLVVAKKQNRFL